MTTQKRPQNCGTSYCSCIECVMEPDYKELWEQMCERCDYLDEKLAQLEQEPASGLTPKGYFIKGWDARGMLEGLKGSVVTDAAMRQYMTEIPDTTPPQPEREPVADINVRPSPHGGLGIASVLSHKLPVGSWLLYTTPPSVAEPHKRKPLPAFTTGHCKEKSKEGGCQLHNIQCGFPACDRKET